MIGFLFAVIAGAAMSVQGVMNTRLQENVGLWEANAFVQGTAFVLSLIVLWIFGKGSLRSLTAAPWWNLLGGALGLVITVTVMLAIKGLNPTIAISAILIAQLLVAAAIDYFGWMGQEKMSFDWRQWTGVGLMLAGVLLMKWRLTITEFYGSITILNCQIFDQNLTKSLHKDKMLLPMKGAIP